MTGSGGLERPAPLFFVSPAQINFLLPTGAAPGSCAPTAISLGPESDQVFLLLFGTGIRGRSSLSTVTATIGRETAEVLAAGPQGEFVGLDQVNLRLPRRLIGRARSILFSG